MINWEGIKITLKRIIVYDKIENVFLAKKFQKFTELIFFFIQIEHVCV